DPPVLLERGAEPRRPARGRARGAAPPGSTSASGACPDLSPAPWPHRADLAGRAGTGTRHHRHTEAPTPSRAPGPRVISSHRRGLRSAGDDLHVDLGRHLGVQADRHGVVTGRLDGLTALDLALVDRGA